MAAELSDVIDGDVPLAAPREVAQGTIIAYPDVLSMTLPGDTARDVKERPFMRIDPTPPGTRIGDEDNAFPYAYRQGVYVALSSGNKGGKSVAVPDTAFRTNTGNVSIDRQGDSYAIPWGIATIDDAEARPIIGRADVGTVQKARKAVAGVLSGRLGAGDLSRGGGR
jgi:hypothetical protein